MLRSANVTTPLIAVAVFVPARVAPLGFAAKAMVMGPVKLATLLPAESTAVTSIGAMTDPAWAVCGCCVKASRLAAGGGGGGWGGGGQRRSSEGEPGALARPVVVA